MALVNAAPSLDADIDRYLQRQNAAPPSGPLSGEVHHWAGTPGTRVGLMLACLNAAAAPAVSAA
jgi:hypothetical protein